MVVKGREGFGGYLFDLRKTISWRMYLALLFERRRCSRDAGLSIDVGFGLLRVSIGIPEQKTKFSTAGCEEAIFHLVSRSLPNL